jgi:hypothetical protein
MYERLILTDSVALSLESHVFSNLGFASIDWMTLIVGSYEAHAYQFAGQLILGRHF